MPKPSVRGAAVYPSQKVGGTTNILLSADYLPTNPKKTDVTVTVTSPPATWDATVNDDPKNKRLRHVIPVTLKLLKAIPDRAPGDTDEITVVVTNATTHEASDPLTIDLVYTV